LKPITIRNLTFAYDGQGNLFDHCNLDFNTDWKLGLVGRNGRGKTTFLKILQDQLPYRGTVNVDVPIAAFPLSIGGPDELAWDALSNALPTVEEWQVERELNRLQVDAGLLWQPYSTLSGGEQTKLMLAAVFAQPNCFVLLDEPTNHLDARGRSQVATYLQGQRGGFIVTSHDREFLDQVVDHIIAIERQQIVVEQGNYSSYLGQKHLRDATAIKQNQQLRQSISRLKQAQQQRQQWANNAEREKQHNSHADKGFIGAKAAKMMKKAVTMNQRVAEQIEQKKGLLNEVEVVAPLTINVQPSHHDPLLQLSHVGLNINGRQLFNDLSFAVHPHQQVALCGDNGSGKSSLLLAIRQCFAGQVTGKVEIAHGTKVSVVRQHYTGFRGDLRRFATDHGVPYSALLNMLRKLGIDRQTFNLRVEKMSMGQQKKVELARSLVEPAQLYLWDEPLNYLDLENQDQLIRLLQDVRPPLLFVEHDRHFIKAVTSQRVSLSRPASGETTP
jgi:lincosamide and streptogramin A transport system ATP-binding/permease protein